LTCNLAMSLSAGFVITPNYDDLLERNLTALKRHPVTGELNYR
jgi:hypothetical protein